MKKAFKYSISAAAILFGINKYIDSETASNTTKTNGKFFHWEHGDIFYKVAGTGKPILLVHDLNVFSSENEWNKLTMKLSETNKIYTIDLPGCGRSAKPALTYTNYLYVQLITEFIKKVIKEKTIVVTSGLSASFVLKADSMDSSLIETIVMINPPSFSSLRKTPDKYSKVWIQLFHLPIIGKSCYYQATSKTNTEYYLSEKCFFNPFDLQESVVKNCYAAAHQGSGNGKYLYACLKGNYLNINIQNTLKKAETKMILITGEEDLGAAEISASYQNLKPDLIVRTIKSTKKLPHMEAPGKVYNILKETCI
ncbi:MAG: alpha/beta hydrolase [Lachnospiraceae bacterium]|nr:alpha/beta hydrolase [Lachnospiraceae bacterium]